MRLRPPAREDRSVRVPCPSRSPAQGPTWGACRKPRARLPADPGGTWLRCAALLPPGPRSVCPAGPSSPRPGRVSAPPRFPHTLIWSGPGQRARLQLWLHLAVARNFARYSLDLPQAHLDWRLEDAEPDGTEEGALFTGSPFQMCPPWDQAQDLRATQTPGFGAERFHIYISRFSHCPNLKFCPHGGDSGDSK